MICMGSGFAVYYTALKYKEGATMDELDAYLDELIPHVAVYFAVDDLTYLYRGGRVSGAKKFFGNMLGIKPILYINEEGKILNIDKGKGFKKALYLMRGYVKTKGLDLDKYKMFVMHADNEGEATSFAESLRAEFGELDVEIQSIGPVIGSHCGPGTIGLIFHAKEK